MGNLATNRVSPQYAVVRWVTIMALDLDQAEPKKFNAILQNGTNLKYLSTDNIITVRGFFAECYEDGYMNTDGIEFREYFKRFKTYVHERPREHYVFFTYAGDAGDRWSKF